MKNLIFNQDDLKEEDIDETVKRVKLFIINENNELLVADSDEGVQLIGGHIENGESNIETIKREVKEETGIIITDEIINGPFFEIRHYTKNYHNSRKKQTFNYLVILF